MDFFLDDNNAYERLREQYIKYGKIIIAYDFDETIYNTYGLKERTFNMVIDLLKRYRNYAFFILYTARWTEEEGNYDLVLKYISDMDIPLDFVNSDADGTIPEGRKIYYNILLDDKAGLSSAYQLLIRLIEEIESGKI